MAKGDKLLSTMKVNMPRHGNEKYPVEKRIEAVTHWLALGNLRQVEAITKVSYSNLKLWKTQPWWHELELEIKASRRIQTNTKLSKIVDKALGVVEDRITNGDIRYNQKTGEVERVEVSALTATKIATDLMQRQDALEKISSAEIQLEQTHTIQDQLAMLHAEFAKFNKSRTVDIIAKDVSDAVYEERETGLQEGESALQFETGEREEEGFSESSESNHDESGEGPQG